MFHMKAFTVRDLRQRFPDVEARLKRGETLVVRKRQEVIGRIVPEPPKLLQYPDFEEIQKEIFGNKIIERTFTELVREERDRYSANRGATRAFERGQFESSKYA
ncbi:MAG: hypothetical protein ABSH01_27905 [Terriglobia bacterium]